MNRSESFMFDDGCEDSEEEVGLEDWVQRSHYQQQTQQMATLNHQQHQSTTAPQTFAKRPSLQPANNILVMKTPVAPTVPVGLQPLVKCGWLELMNIDHGWTKQWFVLRGTDLSYHKDPGDARLGISYGILPISGCTITSDLTTPSTAASTVGESDSDRSLARRTFGLQMKLSERVYALRSVSQKERDVWISKIESVKDSSSSTSSTTNGGTATGQSPTQRFQHDELCYGCRVTFTLTRRRHHCRLCLHSYCNNCSKSRYRIPGSGVTQPVRVCDDCYKTLTGEPTKSAGNSRKPSTVEPVQSSNITSPTQAQVIRPEPEYQSLGFGQTPATGSTLGTTPMAFGSSHGSSAFSPPRTFGAFSSNLIPESAEEDDNLVGHDFKLRGGSSISPTLHPTPSTFMHTPPHLSHKLLNPETSTTNLRRHTTALPSRFPPPKQLHPPSSTTRTRCGTESKQPRQIRLLTMDGSEEENVNHDLAEELMRDDMRHSSDEDSDEDSVDSYGGVKKKKKSKSSSAFCCFG